MFQSIKNALTRTHAAASVAAGTALATIAPSSMAQTAYDGLTTAVDWSDVGTSLVAVGVAIIGIFVVFKGIKLVVRMVKGA